MPSIVTVLRDFGYANEKFSKKTLLCKAYTINLRIAQGSFLRKPCADSIITRARRLVSAI